MITVPEVRMSPDLRLATNLHHAARRPATGRGLAAFDRNKKTCAAKSRAALTSNLRPRFDFASTNDFEKQERIEKLAAKACRPPRPCERE